MTVQLSIENHDVLRQTSERLSATGIPFEVHESWKTVISSVTTDRIIVLETGKDAAALTRTVYELYRKSDQGGPRPCIVVMADLDVLNANPSVCAWEIDGMSAVVAVVSIAPDVVTDLCRLVQRLLKVAKPKRKAAASKEKVAIPA